MHVKRRRLPNFEACSVALFASLAMGAAALPARPPTAPSTRALASTAPAAAAIRPTLRPGPRSGNPARQDAPPDGSVSSAGFDEALK